MNSADMEAFQRIIDRSKRIVFFGGAGVSTASGIPVPRTACTQERMRGFLRK